MRNPARFLLGNPVVLKELRGRMRGPRAFAVLTGYLSLVGGVAMLSYLVLSAASDAVAGQVDGGAIGRTLFQWVVGLQLFLVTFIAPAFTAGAISGERERQTYDLLRTTLLPASNLVVGKLFSALAYILLLLLSTIPLQSLSFILGGTDLPDMLIASLLLMVTAIFLGTIGTYFSARLGKTLPASIATYGTALTVVVGTGVILLVFFGIREIVLDQQGDTIYIAHGMVLLPLWVLMYLLMSNRVQNRLTPQEASQPDLSRRVASRAIAALFATVVCIAAEGVLALVINTPKSTEWLMLIVMGLLTCLNPLATMLATREYLVNQQQIWTFEYTFHDGTTATLPSPWIIFVALYLLIALILFVLTTRQVGKVDEF